MDAPDRKKYTCAEYRDEMRLLGLRRRLEREALSEDERARVQAEIERLEASTSLR